MGNGLVSVSVALVRIPWNSSSEVMQTVDWQRSQKTQMHLSDRVRPLVNFGYGRTSTALDQNGSTIDHTCLASPESFLRQGQTGLGYVTRLCNAFLARNLC
jgi:hypothetical protein